MMSEGKVGRDGLSRAEAQRYYERRDCMPKRIDDEARIVQYFSTEPPDKIALMYKVVKGIVLGRLGVPTKNKRQPAKRRLAETNSAADAYTQPV